MALTASPKPSRIICCRRCCSTRFRSRPAGISSLRKKVEQQARDLAQKETQMAALKQEVGTLKEKVTQIDALAARLDAIEQQARASRPERLAAAMH